MNGVVLLFRSIRGMCNGAGPAQQGRKLYNTEPKKDR